MTTKKAYLDALLEQFKAEPPELDSWLHKEYNIDYAWVRIYIRLYEPGINDIYKAEIRTIDKENPIFSRDLITTDESDEEFFKNLVDIIQAIEKDSMDTFFKEQSELLSKAKPTTPNEFDPVYKDMKQVEYHKNEIISIANKYRKNFFQKLFNI